MLLFCVCNAYKLKLEENKLRATFPTSSNTTNTAYEIVEW